MTFTRTYCFIVLAIILILAPGVTHAGATDPVAGPEITLSADVLQSDGRTPRVYHSADGPYFWKTGLPIARGDKIKLNVYVQTGAVDVHEAVIRLDNARVADLTSSPWNTTIDTATLDVGSHRVAVWAQGAGTDAPANEKTFSFYVVDQHEDQIKPTLSVASSTEEAPKPPQFLAGKPIDANASVIIRSTNILVDRQLTGGSGPITISQPALLFCKRPPGSIAVRYAYKLMRDGRAIFVS